MLYRSVMGKRQYIVADGDNQVTGAVWNDYYDTAALQKVSVFRIAPGCTCRITGLAADLYYLEEIQASDGLCRLEYPTEFMVQAEGTVIITYDGETGQRGEKRRHHSPGETCIYCSGNGILAVYEGGVTVSCRDHGTYET